MSKMRYPNPIEHRLGQSAEYRGDVGWAPILQSLLIKLPSTPAHDSNMFAIAVQVLQSLSKLAALRGRRWHNAFAQPAIHLMQSTKLYILTTSKQRRTLAVPGVAAFASMILKLPRIALQVVVLIARIMSSHYNYRSWLCTASIQTLTSWTQ